MEQYEREAAAERDIEQASDAVRLDDTKIAEFLKWAASLKQRQIEFEAHVKRQSAGGNINVAVGSNVQNKLALIRAGIREAEADALNALYINNAGYILASMIQPIGRSSYGWSFTTGKFRSPDFGRKNPFGTTRLEDVGSLSNVQWRIYSPSGMLLHASEDRNEILAIMYKDYGKDRRTAGIASAVIEKTIRNAEATPNYALFPKSDEQIAEEEYAKRYLPRGRAPEGTPSRVPRSR
jgi:predicted Zn-dependent protease